MIKDYIKSYFKEKLKQKQSLLIYDAKLFYHDLVLELDSEDIKVFDASKNVITERENAFEYWIEELPKNLDRKMVFYVPFDKKTHDDQKATDPFIIFASGGTIFPDEASDSYKQLCLSVLPEKADKINAIFEQEDYPSFAKIDALDGGNAYPSIKSGLGAQSEVEILMAFLNPSENQIQFLKEDKSWQPELKQFAKDQLGIRITSKKFETISSDLWRVVLFSEFVFDLPVDLPDSLKEVKIASDQSRDVIFKVCKQLRGLKDSEELYTVNANKVSDELRLPKLFNLEKNLGKINTFAFEDSSFFEQFKNELLDGKLNKAKDLAEISSRSIWSLYDDERRFSWQLGLQVCNLVLEIEKQSKLVNKEKDINEIIKWYSNTGYSIDSLHREMENGVQNGIYLSETLQEVVDFGRAAYHKFMEKVQEDFQNRIEQDGLLAVNIQRNISLYDDKVKPLTVKGKKTVYILADALRYELAANLSNRLDRADFECELEPSLAFIPTVTKFGMAALMPEASKNLKLKLSNQKLEPYLNDSLSKNRQDRLKYSQSILGDKCGWYWDQDIINDKYEEKDILLVTTTEIDQAGENTPDNAQMLIERALLKILKICNILKQKGYEEFIMAADHGFVLFNSYKAGNKAEKPTGDWSLQKSRCLAGVGDSDPNHILLSDSDLGVTSDVKQFLFLKNYATYERGKKFFHEGLSLQECITPLLSFRPLKKESKQDYQLNLTYKGKTTGYVTTRRPSIEISCFGDSLFDESIDVMIEAIGGGNVVGVPANTENVNSTSGFIEIAPGQSFKITLVLDDEYEGQLEIVAKSPSSGMILSQIKLETDYL